MRKSGLLLALATGLAALTASGASAQNSGVQGAIDECNKGIASSCLNVALTYSDEEDPENPQKTLQYSKLACDKGHKTGCRYLAMTNYQAALHVHQRILKTTLSGDPKGVWKYKSDINSAVDRATGYYRNAQQIEPSLNDDWAQTYQDLEELRQ